MGRLAVLPSVTYYGHRGLVLSEIMPFGLGISNDTLCRRDLLLGKLFVWRELSVRCPGVWSTLKHCCISVVASSFDQTGWGIISEFWLDWVRGVFKGECMGPQFKREQMEVRRWGGKRTEPASGDGQSRHRSPGCPVIEHLPADHWIAQ